MMLPVILLLFLGALEMTNLHFLRQTAADAAYEGARAALVAGGSAERARQRAEQHLFRCGVRGAPEVRVSGTEDGVSVQVVVPINRNSYGLTYFSRGMAVSRACTLRRETYRGNL